MSKVLKTVIGTFLICMQMEAKPCDPNFGEFSLKGEYLFWKLEDSPPIIPLVIEGPSYLPLLDQPKTSIALGGQDTHNNWRSGGRLTAAYSSPYQMGAEASCFFLNCGSNNHSIDSIDLPRSWFLSVPFFDVTTSAENAYPLSDYASLYVKNAMQGAELNGLLTLNDRSEAVHEHCYKIELLAGFRSWSFQEKATFFTKTLYLNSFFETIDQFCAYNNFYGGQLGLKFHYLFARLYFTGQVKAAFGKNRSTLGICGKVITNDFNGVQTIQGGLFALPTNIGKHQDNTFCILPEINLNMGYQLLKCLRIELGYTFLYASRMLWATEQFNPHLNPTQNAAYEHIPTPHLTGLAAPRPLYRRSSLWVQGLNIALEFIY